MEIRRAAPLVGLVLVCACAVESGAGPPADRSQAAEDAVMETASRPSVVAAPTDEAPLDLPAPPWTVRVGMQFFARHDVEAVLDGFARGGVVTPDAAGRAALVVVRAAERIDWTLAKNRTRNPGDFDAVARDLRTRAEALRLAVSSGAADAARTAADGVVQGCADCHALYR